MPATPTSPRKRGSWRCCTTRTRYRASLCPDTVKRRSANARATSDRATESIVCSSSAVKGPPNRDELYVTRSNQKPRTTLRREQPATVSRRAAARALKEATLFPCDRNTRALYALPIAATGGAMWSRDFSPGYAILHTDVTRLASLPAMSRHLGAATRLADRRASRRSRAVLDGRSSSKMIQLHIITADRRPSPAPRGR